MSQQNRDSNQQRPKYRNQRYFHPYPRPYAFYHNDIPFNGPPHNLYNPAYGNYTFTSREFTIPNRYMKPTKKGKHSGKKNENISRPAPFQGTEEYTMQQIQETSDMIKKQLLMPQTEIDNLNATTQKSTTDCNTIETSPPRTPGKSAKNPSKNTTKTVAVGLSKSFNVEAIHEKIINHITNLKHGKKVNLICSTNSSGYDNAIQNIQKQKRLELSKALREMCSNQTTENSEFINSIIPDIGINIGDLPLDVIQELRATLDIQIENDFPSATLCNVVKTEPIIPEDESFFTSVPELQAEPTNELKMESPEWICSPVEKCDNSTQTDPELTPESQYKFKENVASLSEAIDTMMEIDAEIDKLTKMRQAIYTSLYTLNAKEIKKPIPEESVMETTQKPDVQKTLPKSVPKTVPTSVPKFKIEMKETILVIQQFKSFLLAGSQSGKLFYLDLKRGKLVHTLKVSDSPITTICMESNKKKTRTFLGSNQSVLYEYIVESRNLRSVIDIGDVVQCMDYAWDLVFIGTAGGYLKTYSLAKCAITFEEQMALDSIVALKTAKEGARRVLLVAAQNSAVCIRDAITGLHMRTLFSFAVPTVHALLMKQNLVYCRTANHEIQVFGFHEGHICHTFKLGAAAAATPDTPLSYCMKIVGDLLFASQQNGTIWMFSVKSLRQIGEIQGPGGNILSMDVVGAQVIVGTTANYFKSIPIPQDILNGFDPITLKLL